MQTAVGPRFRHFSLHGRLAAALARLAQLMRAEVSPEPPALTDKPPEAEPKGGVLKARP